MITTKQRSTIDYLVICINDFAERYGVSSKAAYKYLSRFGGIEFLLEHYDVEHTLSMDDALADLEHVCRQNGGKLA